MQALPQLSVGTRVRILPNHACATGAQHDQYRVIRGSGEVVANWPARPRLVIDMREHVAFITADELPLSRRSLQPRGPLW